MIRLSPSIHPSIDFPLVALIIVCLPKSFPKFFQNPFKILPKPSQNRPRTLPEPSQNPPSKMNALKTRFFQFFAIFWRAQGLPKSSENRKKSQKNEQKTKSKKTHVLNTIFSRFFMFLTSENDSKIDVFSILFRKRRFSENHCFS